MGALGALSRYGLEGLVSKRFPGAFPWGTFAVNITGAFLLGLIFTVTTERLTISPPIRSGITIGFLGAYTTFSTLSLESFRLIEQGAVGLGLLNSFASLGAGLVATFLGVTTGRAIG
ncbi:MAG TPA: fluoride efflux transporter CrcB [Actinomycetota bacterium]|nr:fluoride efflux transporter CrcB [Actinomycetota bacterium]